MGVKLKQPELNAAEREELWRLINEPGTDAVVRQRAQILLYAADGHDRNAIAQLLGIGKTAVQNLLRRYQLSGFGAAIGPISGGGYLSKVSPELKAYICKIAAAVPSELEDGPNLNSWQGSTLLGYLREHAQSSGFKELKRMTAGMINSIIAEGKVAAAQNAGRQPQKESAGVGTASRSTQA
ncbi:MAG: helix-turn-helix domain-containing protein [Proteobacteria bacterium]|uniref:Helix-turn-helix domain-containing protein n=1 Tax=Candidatus Avisuccinivibrio stercorigallinarum TaxID=2840704 RepID=A0A9D9D9U2_9GAMM|nr:helix-turn-helix domain-containing protein [Candidatus Avisuccinivibrio stercorigallinarum]